MATITRCQPTNKGRELALKLAPYMGSTYAITSTCSAICRAATTYARIQEESCNGPGDWIVNGSNSGPAIERWQARIDKREAELERRLAALVANLQTVNGEPCRVVFNGDPRGATVKVKVPGADGDSWGRDGFCVPGA